MKRTISIILPFCALILGGCNYLDTIPGDSLTGEHFWQTANDAALQQYCNTYYPSLIIGHGAPNGWDCGPMFTEEYRTDNILPSGQNAFAYGQNIIKNTDSRWNWKVIRGCNTFIENYEKSPASEQGKAKAAGQMYFFKAWDYFNKVVVFGDVPWYDSGSDKTDPSLYKGRDSRILVMKNIVKNIDKAIELLPVKTEEYMVSKDAALCLKARICLFEGTWRKYRGIEGAEEYLKLAYDAAGELMKPEYSYSLYTEGGPDECYFNLFVQDDYKGNPEIILSRQYNPDINSGHEIHMQMSNSGHGMSRDAYEEYLCSNTGLPISICGCHDYHDGFLKEIDHRDLRLVQTICVPDANSKHHHFLYKNMGTESEVDLKGGAPNILGHLYSNQEQGRYFFSSSSTGYAICKHFSEEDYAIMQHHKGKTDCPVMRFGEVLLIRAEAGAELGVLTQEELDKTVNKLRDRVGFPFHLTMQPTHDPNLEEKYPNVTGPNADLIREIRRERRVELFCEGYRWNDIMRWHVGDEIFNHRERRGAYMDPALYTKEEIKTIGDLVGLDENGFIMPYKVKGQYKPNFTEKNYLSNIPLDEIALNPKLEQNPGW